MLKKIIDFYRALPPAERPVSLTDEEAVKLTKKLRLQSFFLPGHWGIAFIMFAVRD